MLVKSMTNKEIVREVTDDYERVKRKMRSHVNEMGKILKRTGKYSLKNTFDYVSPNKNNWFYTLEFKNKKSIIKNEFSAMTACWWISSKGFRLAIPYTGGLPFLIYSGHLFDRYKERLGLDMDNRMDIIRHFFEHNNNSGIRSIDESDNTELDINGSYEVYAYAKDGIMLGYTDLYAGCVVLNTFVSSDILFNEQEKIKSEMDELSVEKQRETGIDEKEMINDYRAVKKLNSMGIYTLNDIDKSEDKFEFLCKATSRRAAERILGHDGLMLRIYGDMTLK